MSDVRWALRRALKDKVLYDTRRRVRIDLDEIAHPADLAALRAEYRDWGSGYEDCAGLGVTFKPRTVLEIGVRLGYSAYCFCSGSLLGGTRRVRFTGVDAERDTGPPLYAYRTLAMAAETLRRYLPEVKTTWCCWDTRDGLPPEIAGPPYDLIHVDGDQSEEGTLADLRLVWPSLTFGKGLLVVSHANEQARSLAVADFMTHLTEAGEPFSSQYVHNDCGMVLFRRDIE